MFVRSAYSYDKEEASRESGIIFNDPSLTVQSQKDDADINVIVKRFGLTGQLPENVRIPSYGDYDTVNDFQTAMNAVRAAEEGFMELPADLRKRFHNDPQELLDFVVNGDNIDEAIKLGLVPPRDPTDDSKSGSVPEPKVESGKVEGE